MELVYRPAIAFILGATLSISSASAEQLANSYVQMSTTQWQPGSDWYCDYGQTGCSATAHGVPNGTYVASTKTLTVNTGDIIIVDGTNSSTNNYNSTAAYSTVETYITCGTNSNGLLNPVASPYMLEDVYNYQSSAKGNHHMVHAVRGICQATASGSLTVSLLTEYAGPQVNVGGILYGLMTLDGVDDSNYGTGMVVQQYSTSGLNVLELASVNASGSNYRLPIDGDLGGDVAVQLQTAGQYNSDDQIYVNSETTATICGNCFDEYNSSIHGGMNVTAGLGHALQLGYAGPNLNSTDMPLQSIEQFSMFYPISNMQQYFDGWANWASGENGDITSQNQYTQIQALVFGPPPTMGTFKGYQLSDVQSVPASSDWTQGGSTYTFATASITLVQAGVLDATALAQVYETFGSGSFATCATYVTVLDSHGSQVAQSLGAWRKMSEDYNDFPFESHEMFNLDGGNYTVEAQLACPGISGNVTGIASGSALDTIVYQP